MFLVLVWSNLYVADQHFMNLGLRFLQSFNPAKLP